MRASSLLLAPVVAGLLLSGTVSHNPERPAARPVPVEVEPPFVPNMPPVEAAPVNTPLASRFEATTDHGRIGIWDEYTVDEAADNLFHIHLDRLPTEGDAVWLEYELIGISSHDAVPH